MKTNISTFIFVVTSLLIVTDCWAQPSLTDTSGLSIRLQQAYGKALPFGKKNAQTLYFDFYEQPTDNPTPKPLVITVFGGGFIAGTRTYEDMVAWCTHLARKGYAAASIDYRLLPAGQLTSDHLIKAGYMATQDVSSAIRYFKSHHQEYNIDTNQIFLLGNSAGSVAILHTIYMDEDERPQATLTPERLSPLHAEGDTTHSPDVAGAILLWGSIFDTTMIDIDEQTPLCLIHGSQDKVLPIGAGNAFSKKYFPIVYGSESIAARLTSNGIKNFELHRFDHEAHAFYFKYLTMFQLDATKFNLCLNLALDFIQKTLTN